jgi:hypothetical protein
MNAAVDAGRNDVRELTVHEIAAISGGEIRRSMPNGRTDVIKAMGNTKWDDDSTWSFL